MTALFWFRNDLRIQDNLALYNTISNSEEIIPVYIFDRDMGQVPKDFYLQCLSSLKKQLGGLYVFEAKNPYPIIEKLAKKYKVDFIGFNVDPEYYHRDQKLMEKYSHVVELGNHLTDIISSTPGSYSSAAKYSVQPPAPKITKIKVKKITGGSFASKSGDMRKEAWSYYSAFSSKIPGYHKPSTSPNSIKPSTSHLSPYLARGCIGCRELFAKIPGNKINQESFKGQLIWREFFHANAIADPHFNQQNGNRLSKPFGYSYSRDKQFQAWKMGKTGFPFIDALMIQLREEGWMHHLGRHAVACFLTRGDLFKHWELGMDVFDEWLIDRDYSMNAGNWMWVSSSAFFHQYNRIYSPIGFGKKTDPNGDFIRKYIPKLAKYPAKYIFAPWEAPDDVQKKAGCIIGRDYPMPIVDHEEAKNRNISKIAKYYKK